MTTLAMPVPNSHPHHITEGGDRSRVAAFGVLLLAWPLAVASVVLWIWNRPPIDLGTWFFLVDVMVAVVYGGVGALILSRRVHAVGWIFALAAVGCGLSAFGWQYMLRAEQADGLPLDWLIGPAVSWGWVPGTLALVTVVPWLVRDPSSETPATLGVAGRVAIAAGWAVALFATATRLTDPVPWPDAEPFQPLGVRSESWGHFVEASLPWMFGVVVLLGALATLDVARRWRSAPDRTASGLAWLAVGSALMTISFVPLVFPANWFEGGVAVPTVTPISHLIAQGFLPAATVVVILRQRLWGLDLALNRTLVHSLLSGALIGVYVIVVFAVDQLMPGSRGAAAIGAGAVAVLVLPLRTWLQGRVDRLVLGAAAAPDTGLRQMGRVLGADEPGGLVGGVAAHLATSFRLGSVSVIGVSPDSDHELVLADVGTPEGPVHEIDLIHAQHAVGRLVVTAPFGERLDGRTLDALRDLAPLVTASVRLATINDEMTRVGTRLSEARAHERRILRRDLHDGLGPALAGIGLGLRAYRNLVTTDPTAAEALLDQLSDEVDRRVDDIRQLSRQLLPPVLDDAGLVAALHELADRYGTAGVDVVIDVVVDAVDGPADAAPMEVAAPIATSVYAIATEALTNAHRHGHATQATISLRELADCPTGTRLLLEITNDGEPIDADAPAGIGLRSMRERAVELGGSFELGVGEGGAPVVRALLPREVPA